ncbi:MAG: RDD family protein [Flavobacterium sp.]|nr:RDD family protein [Aeromicrobium sp.]
MTPPAANQPPPPPPGYQPPPGYGQAPQGYGQSPPGYFQGYPTGPATPYASWWSRVGATVIDLLIGIAIAVIPLVAGAIIAFKDAEVDPVTSEISGGDNGVGVVLMGLSYLLVFVFTIWNSVFRQGRKGQSLGKSVVGIQVVRADTGQFLGAGTGFLRWPMASILGGICFLDYLWPLWDGKNQTWHDMVAGSVVTTK